MSTSEPLTLPAVPGTPFSITSAKSYTPATESRPPNSIHTYDPYKIGIITILQDAIAQIEVIEHLEAGGKRGKGSVKSKEVMDEVSDVINHLLQSHTLLNGEGNGDYQLQTPPSAPLNAQKMVKERNEVKQTLIALMAEIEATGTHTVLDKFVEVEDARRSKIQEAMSRAASPLQKELHALQSSTIQEAADFEQQLLKLDEEILLLKDTLSSLVTLSTRSLAYGKKENTAHLAALNTKYMMEEAAIQEEIQKVMISKGLEEKVFETTIKFLEQQRDALDNEILKWMQTYETDTDAIADTLETLKANRLRDLDEFERCVAQYEKYEKVVALEKERLAKELEEKALLLRRTHAARRIQKGWRLWKETHIKPKKKKDAGKKGASPTKVNAIAPAKAPTSAKK